MTQQDLELLLPLGPPPSTGGGPSASRRRGGRVAGRLLLVLGLGVVAVGGVAYADRGVRTVRSVQDVLSPDAEQAGLYRLLSAATVAPPSRGGKATPAPVRVTIPRLNVTSSLVGLGLTPQGEVQVPEDYQQAGWFTLGPKPGDPGAAIVVGHVDSHVGPGVFYHLGTLKDGDLATVTRTDGSTVTYAVDAVDEYSKRAFPSDKVYGRTPDTVLRLITCGGAFDRTRESYDDNIVVSAHEITIGDPADHAARAPSVLQALGAAEGGG